MSCRAAEENQILKDVITRNPAEIERTSRTGMVKHEAAATGKQLKQCVHVLTVERDVTCHRGDISENDTHHLVETRWCEI